MWSVVWGLGGIEGESNWGCLGRLDGLLWLFGVEFDVFVGIGCLGWVYGMILCLEWGFFL